MQGCGDWSIEHFFMLLTLVHSIAKKEKKKLKVKTPVTPSPLPIPHLPHSSKPLRRSRGTIENPRAQGCHQLPNTPCASPSPARKRRAQPSPSTPKKASLSPPSPVVISKVNSPRVPHVSQNGGDSQLNTQNSCDRMVSLPQPSSSHNSPFPALQNPFLPCYQPLPSHLLS